MRVRNLLILLLTIVLTAGLAFVVFVGVQQGPYTFRPTYGLVSSVELNGGTAVTLRVEPYIEDLEEDEEKPKADDALVLEAMEMFEKRLDARGFYDITMTREGDDKIRIEMYTDDYEEISDSGDLTQYICEKGILKFYDVEGNYLIDNAAMEPGTADILRYDDMTYMLYFKLSEEGEKAFDKLKEDYGKDAEFIVEYDGVELATRQYSKSIKNGQFAVGLGFTKRETMNVAYQLNTGILNATFHVEQARSAMPTMGESVFMWIMYSALAAIAVTLILLVIKFKGLGGQDMFPGIYALFQKCPSARRGGDEHDSFYFRIVQKLIKIVADRDIVLFAEGICLFSDPVAHLDDTDEFFIFHIPDDLPLCVFAICTYARPV